MEKNQEFIGTVCAMGANGEGIIKQDGRVVFVPFTLLGEKVKYKILKVTSKCIYAKAIEILTPSEIRVRPKCQVFSKCGGCQLQHIKYQNQLTIKEANIKNVFKKVANLDVVVMPTIRGDNEYRYRNKLQLPVSNTLNGTKIGFYAENSHRIVPIIDCPINAVWTKDIISAFYSYIQEFNIKGYDEINNSGYLREITVKEIKGNLIITVVILRDELIGKERLIQLLKDNVKYPFSLFININAKNTNVIYGEKFKLIYGEPNYYGDMLGIKYKIGVQSFMQVNSCVCSKLYSAVRALVDADDKTVVIDAYSGAGLMTAILAEKAKKTIGIEVVKEAVDCANDLATINKLDDKISNYLGKCEDILPDIISQEINNKNEITLVLDPPRKGCDLSVIKSIINSDIKKIIYVSCKPSTLARDVGLIVGTLAEENGEIKKLEAQQHRYKITYLRPFDMFAQTKHVETLVCLEKNS